MESIVSIIEVDTLDEMMLNFELVVQLTPTLTEVKYSQYLQDMIPHKYFQIVAKYNGLIVGVSGYWIGTKLYCGKYLEIDNFVVDKNYRSQNIGHFLIEKLEQIAIINQCDVMMLDAYLQNTQAHRFYEKHHFSAKGYHFIKKVSNLRSTDHCLK